MHIYWYTPKWDALLGQLFNRTTGIMSIHSSLIRLCLIFTLSFKYVCFAIQIPRKLDICMKAKNIILPGKNDSSISDRQVRDCPDVNEKTIPQRIPRRYRDRRDTICMKGWSLMYPSKNSEEYVRGIIQRLKHTKG